MNASNTFNLRRILVATVAVLCLVSATFALNSQSFAEYSDLTPQVPAMAGGTHDGTGPG